MLKRAWPRWRLPLTLSRRTTWSWWWLRPTCAAATGALTTWVVCRHLHDDDHRVRCVGHVVETPDYLIPRHLRDVRARFLHYASVRRHITDSKTKKKKTVAYMTPDDFVLALLAGKAGERITDTHILAELTEWFAQADTNGDAFISFPEFRFLFSLLASRPREVELLAHIVQEEHGTANSIKDASSSSSSVQLTMNGFASILRGLTGDEALVRSFLKPQNRNNGLTVQLFGREECPRRCTLDDLTSLIDRLRVALWSAEFRLYADLPDGSLSAGAFSALISRNLIGEHPPYYLVHNMRALQAESCSSSSSSTEPDNNNNGWSMQVDAWISFNRIWLCGEAVMEAVELFTGNGAKLHPGPFRGVLRAAGVEPIPDYVVDVIFRLFDRDGDGSIRMEELMDIMKRKSTCHYSPTHRERRSFPKQLYKCLAEEFG